MRNTTLMTVSAVAMMGVGLLAGSFVAPAYSDGVAKKLQPYVENTDALKPGAELAVDKHDTAAHDAPITQRTAQVTAPLAPESEMASTTEGIDVQARRLPNGTPVAVRGAVASATGKMLILDRADGQVKVRLPGAIPALMAGDDVTVYGRLGNRSDSITVQAEAVLQFTAFDEATLHMAPSPLVTAQKMNSTITRGQAQKALTHYRAAYIEL